MFVKLYYYTIKNKDFDKWKKIYHAAKKVYSKVGKFEVFIKKKGQFTEILEIGYYKSKKEHAKISRRLSSDKRIGKLFADFLSIVKKKDIKEKEYETF